MGTKVIQPFDHGLSWTMDEWMERGSHALLADGKVWLIDPVDAPEAIAQAEALGEIAGVIQLLDRHPRACKALAQRYNVPLHILPDELPGTPFQVFTVVRGKFWNERAIWWPDTGTLVVAELVGTNDYYALGKNQVGVHPMMRATGKIVGDHLPVQHLLVGHGPSVHEHAAESLVAAYRTRVRDLVKLPLALRAFTKKRS
jgi:hypothetical protein